MMMALAAWRVLFWLRAFSAQVYVASFFAQVEYDALNNSYSSMSHVLLAGDCVAHIKFTVLLMPNGSDKITGLPLQECQSTKVPEDPEIKAWLALGTKSKKKGGGKKKKGEDYLKHPCNFCCVRILWSVLFYRMVCQIAFHIKFGERSKFARRCG